MTSHPDPAVATHPSGYSFCIITNGKRPEKLRREIASIRALGMPAFEILLAGIPPEGWWDPKVKVVLKVDAARNGRLGEMRNAICRLARYDHLVVADDDLLFQPDYYPGLLAFGEDYDVLATRLLNPDGSRYWDWATHGGPTGHHLLDYDAEDPHVYVTGGLCLMKTSVFEQVQWDEGRGFYQGEDLDFSGRLRAAGFRIRFCRHSTVVHDDPTLTQMGDLIIKWQDRLMPEGTSGEVLTRGFYARSGEGCWMSGQGELVLPATLCREAGQLRFALTCGEAALYGGFPFTVALGVDGQPPVELRFQAEGQSLQVQLTLAPRDSDLVIRLVSERVFVPASLGMGRDQRELSVVLSGLELRPRA